MGKLVIPGLHDSHLHIEMLGESLNFVNLQKCDSIESLQTTVKDHINKNLGLSWIIGINWDQTILGKFPNRLDLDSISSEKPIFLWRACWHIAVANSKALEISGICSGSGNDSISSAITSLLGSQETSLTVEGNLTIPGGVIEMDDHGRPTGILKERAVEIVTKHIKAKSKEERSGFIRRGLEICSHFGLTSVQTNDEEAYEVYRDLQSAGSLPLRVFLTPMYTELEVPPFCKRVCQLPNPPTSRGLPTEANHPTSYLSVNRVKVCKTLNISFVMPLK